MNPVGIIRKKRDGGSLSFEEWAAFFSAYLAGEVADYHVSALLMAVFFQGMDRDETRALTRIMIESGETWSWEGLDGPVADKHSTGGVGDKVSIPLAPIAAACGLKVPMVSGRGLAHTGGRDSVAHGLAAHFVAALERADLPAQRAHERVDVLNWRIEILAADMARCHRRLRPFTQASQPQGPTTVAAGAVPDSLRDDKPGIPG